MTRPVTIYRVRIAAPAHGGLGDVAALLDMLRYEGARVADWFRDRDSHNREILVVTIASEQYVPERWASFGIYPEVAS
jgi:hypothetical protein